MPRKSDETERQCLVTRQSLSKAEMIRFVLAPDGTVVPDLKMRLPGRGVWVTAQKEILQQAVRKGLFARGFKSRISGCEDLPDLVEEQLKRSVLSSLSMTRKAGQIITGFAKVEAAIAQSTLLGLLHAADAAQDGQKKLAQAVRRRFGSDHRIPVIRLFSADALSTALGQGNVVHAALTAGSASKSFITQAQMLEAFVSQDSELSDRWSGSPASDKASAEAIEGNDRK
ncbi:MAG: RNA-binding protein [Cohaesibacter sp.]|nr:RNA-binding protein [Cohaesibacter sp.]